MLSLVNPSGLNPTNMPLIPGKEGSAILCNSSYGPVFGSNNSGSYYDLLIGGFPNQSSGCNSNLNNSSYRCPEGRNVSTFLAGNYLFSPIEIEVLHLKSDNAEIKCLLRVI